MDTHRGAPAEAVATSFVAADLLALLPLVYVLVFLVAFASPLALTDEWYFVHHVMRLEEIDLSAAGGWERFWELFPTWFQDHCVAVPFLWYWASMHLLGFDSRWVMLAGVLVYVVEAVLVRRRLIPSARWSFVASVLILSPSHYMEYLWAFMFTFTLSVLCGILGLFVLDGLRRDAPLPAVWARTCGALALFALAVGCSATGFLVFPAALLALALKDLKPRLKLALGGAIVATAFALSATLSVSPARALGLGVQDVLHFLTLLGGAIWSTPVGLHEYALDLRSVTGAALLVLLGGTVALAAARRRLALIALPLSIAAYSLACAAAASMARPHLGNWHLQLAVPAWWGALACAWRLDAAARTRVSRGLLLGIGGLVLCTLSAFVLAATRYGPDFRAYTARIERYATTLLMRPKQEKPYPPAGDWDLDPNMVLFLAASGSPLFAEPDTGARKLISHFGDDAGATVYVRGEAIRGPTLVLERSGHLVIAVVLHAAEGPPTISSRIGEELVVLLRTKPALAGVPPEERKGTVCYTGMLRAGQLEDGEHVLQVFR